MVPTQTQRTLPCCQRQHVGIPATAAHTHTHLTTRPPPALPARHNRAAGRSNPSATQHAAKSLVGGSSARFILGHHAQPRASQPRLTRSSSAFRRSARRARPGGASDGSIARSRRSEKMRDLLLSHIFLAYLLLSQIFLAEDLRDLPSRRKSAHAAARSTSGPRSLAPAPSRR